MTDVRCGQHHCVSKQKRSVTVQVLKSAEHRGRRYTSVRGAGAPTERRQAVMKKNSLMGDALMSASPRPAEGAHG